jgi:hypothetical protein
VAEARRERREKRVMKTSMLWRLSFVEENVAGWMEAGGGPPSAGFGAHPGL